MPTANADGRQASPGSTTPSLHGYSDCIPGVPTLKQTQISWSPLPQHPHSFTRLSASSDPQDHSIHERSRELKVCLKSDLVQLKLPSSGRPGATCGKVLGTKVPSAGPQTACLQTPAAHPLKAGVPPALRPQTCSLSSCHLCPLLGTSPSSPSPGVDPPGAQFSRKPTLTPHETPEPLWVLC